MELEHIATLSLADQADALCDAELGLIWFHARDLNAFTAHCIHCDDGFWGFVVDEPDLRHLGQSRPCFIASCAVAVSSSFLIFDAIIIGAGAAGLFCAPRPASAA
jgi:hypothetical protein